MRPLSPGVVAPATGAEQAAASNAAMSIMTSRRSMEDSLLTVLVRVIEWLLASAVEHGVVPVGGAVTAVLTAGQAGVAFAVASRPVASSSATVRAMSTMRTATTAGWDDESAR